MRIKKSKVIVAMVIIGLTILSMASIASTQTKEAKKDGFVIGFSNGYFGNTWRAQFVDDAKACGEELVKKGVIKKLIISNTNSISEQIAGLNDLINKKVDAIVVTPRNANALLPVIKKAIAQGTLVVSGEVCPFPEVIAVTGDQARMMGAPTEWLVDQLKGKGNIVYISGVAGETTDTVRNNTVHKILNKYPGIKVLAEAPGDWSPTKANSVMSIFLSTHNNIDAVLAQDVMGLGIIQAYKTARKPFPIMSGDYTFGYLREWAKNPDLVTMTNDYAPGQAYDRINITVRLLQGKKLKDEVLLPCPLDTKVKNNVMIPMPYVVVKKLPDAKSAWVKTLHPFTKVITLEQALKIGEGLADTAALDGHFSDKDIDALFK